MSAIEKILNRLEKSLETRGGNPVEEHDIEMVCKSLSESLKDSERLDWICDSQDGCNEWEAVETLWRGGMLLREAIDTARDKIDAAQQKGSQ